MKNEDSFSKGYFGYRHSSLLPFFSEARVGAVMREHYERIAGKEPRNSAPYALPIPTRSSSSESESVNSGVVIGFLILIYILSPVWEPFYFTGTDLWAFLNKKGWADIPNGIACFTLAAGVMYALYTFFRKAPYALALFATVGYSEWCYWPYIASNYQKNELLPVVLFSGYAVSLVHYLWIRKVRKKKEVPLPRYAFTLAFAYPLLVTTLLFFVKNGAH